MVYTIPLYTYQIGIIMRLLILVLSLYVSCANAMSFEESCDTLQEYLLQYAEENNWVSMCLHHVHNKNWTKDELVYFFTTFLRKGTFISVNCLDQLEHSDALNLFMNAIGIQDLRIKDEHGKTVLHYVVSSPIKLQALYKLLYMAEYRKIKELWNIRDNDGQQALHVLGQQLSEGDQYVVPAIQKLVHAGADPQAIDSNGKSLIDYLNDEIHILRLLCSQKNASQRRKNIYNRLNQLANQLAITK